MHLLAAQPGIIDDGGGAIDLGQTPADVVILSAADTELACLASAYDRLAPPFTLRLANFTRLFHPMSVDLYVDQVIGHARLVVLRLLGGRSYWSYGLDQVAVICRQRNITLVVLPGDDRPDADIQDESLCDAAFVQRLWSLLIMGGVDNARQMLALAGHHLGLMPAEDHAPRPLPRAGLYRESGQSGGALVVFYRALMLAGDLAPVDALLDQLAAQGMAAQGLYVHSLKDSVAAQVTASVVHQQQPDVILNLTAFAASTDGRGGDTPFAEADCPVLQVILAGGSEQAWRDSTAGLAPRDIAMQVALPEVDGRVITRAISFKAADRHAATQCDIASHRPVPDRVNMVAAMAVAWQVLRQTPPAQRRVGLVLTNYPNRQGRVGNAVGLDTPASTIGIIQALMAQGYQGGDLSGDLMVLLQNAQQYLSLTDYCSFFSTIPAAAQTAMRERWGDPACDPSVTAEGFRLPILMLGHLAVGVQPSRGHGLDPQQSSHDLTLAPPHAYLAFYAWLRRHFGCHALLHVGKHGNLEWLPGKGLALDQTCFPEIALGPLPHFYPFIVNDPGEGSQAKRRAQAVIIDHLTPPMTRAETYGPLKDLERLVDEYFDAATLDPRRLPILRRDIVTMMAAMGLDRELGIDAKRDSDAALTKLDAHLCDLKEMQIRDGLHVFGQSPTGEQRINLVVALLRAQRGGLPQDRSILRALAADLGFEFDPLDCDMSGLPPRSPAGGDASRPPFYFKINGVWGEGKPAWRSQGDVVEYLELLAHDLVAGELTPPPTWKATRIVLDMAQHVLIPAVDISGPTEMASLLRGLNGGFVPPGPSGAPTRGRPDTLPTGKNFYATDARMVPTQAAWSLGWKSACLLTERHFQDHGEWPISVALSAWGTSAMRTGGDDMAQALALMGVRPTWDGASGRVTGFEIMPASLLDRPRVDVTLRISGFFRDAFPGLIDLFDAAVRAVAALDEPADVNPLAARVKADQAALGDAAAARIYGSKPGAYGAGLQDLIDSGRWQSRDDLAQAYIQSSGWAYGAGGQSAAAHQALRERLGRVQAVIHNQDNREHDILDSDEYYEFEGGLAAAVTTVSGQTPAQWHGDHSRPEAPRIRTLQEEVARVVRGRVVNPTWIAGAMRHGYRGAAEMAATVEYLFAFAATTDAVQDHQFDLVAEAYLEDPAVLDFFAQHNPAALDDIKARLNEAIRRDLWHPRRNSIYGLLE